MHAYREFTAPSVVECSCEDTLRDSDYPMNEHTGPVNAGQCEKQGPGEMVPEAAPGQEPPPTKQPAGARPRVTEMLETLSDAAVTSRLNRLFAPRSNGSYKVPQELLEKWKTDEGKDEIVKEFRRQGYDKDCV